MESKKSLSLFREDSQSPASPSGLRALASSPTRRLSLRRSRRDSISTTRSSCSSLDPTGAISCVTRATSRDECALHRFIVWAAVQRNACQKMSPSERLECPLLRCRKRFPNHELMLRHLYTCDQLPNGEYWCYDCEQAERFTDGQCKRCLGHPGKRRKILSIAKNFFSSLGHKSKKDGLSDLDMEEAAPPPPSYDSLLIHPQEVELLSNEILEIDSREIPLPLPTQPPPSLSAVPSAASTSSSPSMQTNPSHTSAFSYSQRGASSFHTAELDTLPTISDQMIDWELDAALGQSTGLPEVSIVNPAQSRNPERPSLQVNTCGLEQYRAQFRAAATRSKKLSPSSSLRSNASTNTTNTTSSGISPVSAWSGAWTIASGFESDLTSPTSDFVGNGDFLLSRGWSNASRQSYRESKPQQDIISELPADLPMSGPPPQSIPRTLCPETQFYSFEPSAPSNFSVGSNVVFTEKFDQPSQAALPKSSPPSEPSTCVVEANSLVESAWETLQAHISSSMEKLKPLSHNRLVQQLQRLDSKTIATTGLVTLRELLNGQVSCSAVDTLCFVHVTYSLSLVVHENDTRARAKQLFARAYAYGNQLLPQDRDLYLEVASAIWQPLDLSAVEMNEILLSQYAESVSRSGSLKGKERVVSNGQSKSDSLIEVAQFFLDELEYAVLPDKEPSSLDVVTSGLWLKHLDDMDVTVSPSSASPFKLTMGILAKMISQQYPNADGLASRLDRFHGRVSTSSISTVRRAELELIQAGKGCMSTEEYFDDYVLSVREQCNELYRQKIPGFTPRSTYHALGIELMEHIMKGLYSTERSLSGCDPKDEGSLDDFFQSMTTGLESNYDDQLDQLLADDNLLLSMGQTTLVPTIDPLALEQPSLDPETTVGWVGEGGNINPSAYIPNDAAATAEPNSEASRSPNPPAGTVPKVEAHDCCDICGYRPKGDPQWFKGSMAKHKKLQHAATPPKIYRCPYPGCTSQYKNRPDNLRQHQLDKSHFVDGEGERRPSKRKKLD